MVAVVGLAMVIAPWWFMPWSDGIAGVFLVVWKSIISAAGAAFVGLGLAVGWTRVGAALDRDAGKLFLLSRVLFYTFRTELPAAGIRRIRLVGGAVPGSRAPAYLELHVEGKQRPVRWGFPQSEDTLRLVVQWIQERIDLPPDAVLGLAGDEAPPFPLDEEASKAFDLLAASRLIKAQWNSDGIGVFFPPMGWKPLTLGTLAGGLFATAFLGFFAYRMLEHPHRPPLWIWAVFAVIPLLFFLVAFHLAKKSLRITVSGGVLRVERTGLIGRRPKIYTAHDITDVDVFQDVSVGTGSRPQTILVVFGRGRIPLVRLQHPALDRHPEQWRAVAAALRAYLSR
ncbi:MAG: hypothetical protein D6760_12760 [Deltaproteobacteria bacterium]|nr:MAG: hypothetical protein D6760_12760 [Deltaproteobacteria bacterium]